MCQYLPKLYEALERDINLKVDLSNYATNIDLKIATRVNTSKLAAKSDFANLEAEIGNICRQMKDCFY